jgi:hypothetical protein
MTKMMECVAALSLAKRLFPRDFRGICVLVLLSAYKKENRLFSVLQILLKLEKTKEDKAAENKRNELLKFLNASFD